MTFYEMNEVEEKKYKDWRGNHNCVSQVEFTITPGCVGQVVGVRCWECGEKIDVTDYDSW